MWLLPSCLCSSGVGGLDLAVRAVLPGSRVVGYVEQDPYAAAVLLSRMEEGELDPAPVWCGDVRDLGGDELAAIGPVDLVVGGFPCPPASVAGSRRGTADARWLWDEITRLVDVTGAGAVFVENVRGLLSVNGGRAFGGILGDMARRGFNAEWTVLAASEVGAPHRRERVFVLGARPGGVVGDAASGGLGRGRADERPAGAGSAAMADTDRGGREVEWGGGLFDRQRTAPRDHANRRNDWPPGPNDAEGWRAYLAAGGPEPAVRRGDDGLPEGLELAERRHRLRCLGNAVCPQQGAAALRILLERLT